MKIYAAADIHARPARLETICETVARVSADVLVVAGDISRRTLPPEKLRALEALPVPVLAVRGNSDSRRTMRRLAVIPRITCLHLEAVLIGGVHFVGIGGTLALPLRSRLAFRERTLTAAAADLVRPDTVLVTHAPPLGVRDLAFGRLHVGSYHLRRLVLQRRPRLLICGHVHEQAGTGFLGDTLVVNCSMGRGGAGALIHLAPDGPLGAEML